MEQRQLRGDAALALFHTLLKAMVLHQCQPIHVPIETARRAERGYALCITETEDHTALVIDVKATDTPHVKIASPQIWTPGQP